MEYQRAGVCTVCAIAGPDAVRSLKIWNCELKEKMLDVIACVALLHVGRLTSQGPSNAASLRHQLTVQKLLQLMSYRCQVRTVGKIKLSQVKIVLSQLGYGTTQCNMQGIMIPNFLLWKRRKGRAVSGLEIVNLHFDLRVESPT